MLKLLVTGFIAVSITACSGSSPGEGTEEVYIWSHNDYEQDKPLEKALSYGSQMIEADIHLIDGKLYVSHDYPEDLENTPVLEDLYLAPLAERIDHNQGRVLPESTLPFYLAIDVKSETYSTFDALSGVIEPYREYFTRKEDGRWIEGPMRLLISGNRPDLDPEDPDRVAFLDGRIPDIGEGHPSDYYPVISDNWFNYFSWDGTGEIPEEEWSRLQAFVKDAHAEDKLVRFWATPDKETLWRVLMDANVDIINVDDLQGVADFINEEL